MYIRSINFPKKHFSITYHIKLQMGNSISNFTVNYRSFCDMRYKIKKRGEGRGNNTVAFGKWIAMHLPLSRAITRRYKITESRSFVLINKGATPAVSQRYIIRVGSHQTQHRRRSIVRSIRLPQIVRNDTSTNYTPRGKKEKNPDHERASAHDEQFSPVYAAV